MQDFKKELSAIFDSDSYHKLLNESCSLLKLDLNEEFPEILYQYDFKKLNCSPFILADLRETLENSGPSLLSFIKLKFSEDTDDLGGEFPQGETPGEEDRPNIVKKMPVYRNFLLGYLIEFTILKTRPDVIIQYLKCVRIPNAATYAKRLKNWYGQAQSI